MASWLKQYLHRVGAHKQHNKGALFKLLAISFIIAYSGRRSTDSEVSRGVMDGWMVFHCHLEGFKAGKKGQVEAR